MPTEDPYYSRKRVPDEFVKDVGDTGLTPREEFATREKKYSIGGKDIRKFWNPKDKTGKVDPYYQRRKVSDAEAAGVGETGLTLQEEHLTRERKYSLADGSDARHFSSGKGGLTPASDPYYSRKKVPKAETVGIGDTGNTPAEDYGVRERKQSMFQLSDDPFAIVRGHHRESVSGPAMTEAAVAAHRRRSSAVAPDHAHAATNGAHHHSGYDGPQLASIESRPDFPGNNEGTLGGSHLAESSTNGTKPHHGTEEIQEYHDPDSVAPHEVR